jgi:hypothetical protein
MATTETYPGTVESVPTYKNYNGEANASGVSWGAVIGGGFVTAALSVTLLALGAGLGLSSVSPWANAGVSAPVLGAAAIVWMIVLQIIASAMGGYLAGRLRTKWSTVHTHEVYFRDTAHGFLVWAVALVITAAFLAAASARMVGGAAQAAATNQSEARTGDSGAYFIDTLFRSDHPVADRTDASVRDEVTAIFVHAFRQKELSATDKTYLAHVVAARTGLQEADAEQRVADVFTQAQQAADAARKATAHFLMWLFIALLIGAFCASYAATVGGRQRDRVQVV